MLFILEVKLHLKLYYSHRGPNPPVLFCNETMSRMNLLLREHCQFVTIPFCRLPPQSAGARSPTADLRSPASCGGCWPSSSRPCFRCLWSRSIHYRRTGDWRSSRCLMSWGPKRRWKKKFFSMYLLVLQFMFVFNVFFSRHDVLFNILLAFVGFPASMTSGSSGRGNGFDPAVSVCVNHSLYSDYILDVWIYLSLLVNNKFFF